MLLLLGNKLQSLDIVMFVGCYNNLATVFKYQGDLKEAKKYLERAFAMMEQTLEPEHHDVAILITTLLVYFVIKVTWRKHRSMRGFLML